MENIILSALVVTVAFLFLTILRYLAVNKELTRVKGESILKINDLEKQNSILLERLKLADEKFASFQQDRKEALNMAKAAFYDLGSNLNKELLENHKKENAELRKMSSSEIEQTTKKLSDNFQNIFKQISALDMQVRDSKETIDVVKQSLLSPTGAGSLAEITLENLLKNSGLIAGKDYIMQYSFKAKNGRELRPDALIFLPNNNLMIIDAKASQFFLSDENNELLVKSLNTHLKGLSNKEYKTHLRDYMQSKNFKVNNIISLMFLPSEHAVEKISDLDAKFMLKAWQEDIYPVGPTGIVNMLNLAKFQINDHNKSANYDLIISEVKKLLESLASFYSHSAKLGGNIQSLVNNYDKMAASFNSNLLSKAKKINKLGVDAASEKLKLNLDRYQLVTSKTELIDLEPDKNEEQISTKKLELSNE